MFLHATQFLDLKRGYYQRSTPKAVWRYSDDATLCLSLSQNLTEKKIYSYHSRLREIVIASYGYGSGLIVFNSYAVQ
jgi:hypothetical protein